MRDYKFIYTKDSLKYFGEVINDRLIKYINLNENIVGNIYRAKVEKYIKAMDAFILDIGQNKNAILKSSKIVSQIKPGEDILVEVLNVPSDDKLIEVTEKISITDGYLVLSPFSRKSEDRKYPFFLRTKAKDLDSDLIEKRYSFLEEKMDKILKERYFLPTPKLIDDENFTNSLLSEENLVNDIEIEYNESLSKQLAVSSQRKVDFENGNLVIDKLEALTVIDVNSGYTKSHLSKNEMSRLVNLSALDEIAIQISLRDIKKMFLIDFIRVDENTKNEIIENLNLKFEAYKVKAKILGFSRLELLEIIIN